MKNHLTTKLTHVLRPLIKGSALSFIIGLNRTATCLRRRNKSKSPSSPKHSIELKHRSAPSFTHIPLTQADKNKILNKRRRTCQRVIITPQLIYTYICVFVKPTSLQWSGPTARADDQSRLEMPLDRCCRSSVLVLAQLVAFSANMSTGSISKRAGQQR